MAGTDSKRKDLLKTNFAIKHKWEPFYTGGSVVTCDEGKTLLCSCGDSVQVIDVESGEIKCSLAQDDDVTCVSCSPDNDIIVSATRSLLLKQWRIKEEKPECCRTWKAIHTSPVLCMAFDATSTLLATGSSDSTIKIWDMLNQYCTHNLRGSQGVITAVEFHPHDLKLFSASNDYAIRMWDLHTSRCICMLQGHVSAVTNIAFEVKSENDITMISGGRDSVLCLWDLEDSKQKSCLEPKMTIPVYESVEGLEALSKSDTERLLGSSRDDASYILTAGNSGILKVWNMKSGKCVFSQTAKGDGGTGTKGQQREITALLHLKSLGRYATVTFDHNINIFSITNNHFVPEKHLVGYNDEVLDVRFIGPRDSHIAVATNSPLVKVFERKSSSCQLLEGHQDTVLSLDAFKDGRTFASGSKDNSVRIWKVDEKSLVVKCVAVGLSHTQAVATVACARIRSDLLVSGGRDLTLKIWGLLTTTDGDGVAVTNLKVKHTIKAHDKDINSVAISPNDKLAASGSQDKTAKLWNVLDGEQLGTFHGHKRGIWSCQFSPTDQVLGTSSADGTLKLWSLSSFTCLKTLEGHDCSVLRMIFISKGTQIMTSGSNGLLKLWNIKSSECVKTLEGHEDKVWGISVNHDDSVVLSGAADSRILQWEDITEKERDETKQELETTVLRQQELNNLIHEKKFAKAFRLAITLQQPFTALKVLKEMKWEEDGDDIVCATISKLRDDQKDVLLKFVMSWNTNSRNCHEAQKVLNYILKHTHPHDLVEYSNAQSAIEALIPYTERHYQRMSRLAMNTTFVDYVWQTVKLKPMKLCDEKLPAVDSGISSATKSTTLNLSASKFHPLKTDSAFIRQSSQPLSRKRTRKPDKFEESDGDGDSEEDEPESNGCSLKPRESGKKKVSPPKKMRLRSTHVVHS